VFDGTAFSLDKVFFICLNSSMNITIAGYGFVGKAYASLLESSYNITIVDPGYPEHDIPIPKDTDAIIICVATPQDADGSCNMSNVFNVLENTPNVPILIKSTISLGGWQGIANCFIVGVREVLDITFSPEFLRAETAHKDLMELEELYLGGSNVAFWTDIFKKCYQSEINVLTMSVKELILIKYFRNAFLATKVNFFNQVYDLCEAAHINYDNVALGIGMDTRIGNSHTKVNTERGFGGHCFPKDTLAIVNTAKSLDVSLSLINESINYNKVIRKDNV
jgi:UDPglucose 6-dehydrogenase